MNTCHKPDVASRVLIRCLAAVCFIHMAWALDPNEAIARYIRDQWGAERGYTGGPVYGITQTPDGYLWIGTQRGLVRFDGFNFGFVQDPDLVHFPSIPALGLLADAQGNLWIRPQGRSLLSYRDGKFRNVLTDFGLNEDRVTGMCRATNGDLLFVALGNAIIRHTHGKLEKLVSTAKLPNFLVLSMAQTTDGKIWMGTRDSGLFCYSGGQISSVTKGLPDRKVNTLLAAGNGELWVGTDNGLVRWNGSELTSAGIPADLQHAQALALTLDRESNLWIGSADGLMRLNARGLFSQDERDHPAHLAVTALFEDREGNIWTGSASGIERLRDSVFVTYSVADGLKSASNGPVYVDSEDRTWIAPIDGGLEWMKKGQHGRITQAGLDHDVVYSIAGAKDGLWIGRQRGGLTHLRTDTDPFRFETFTQQSGLAQNNVYSVFQSRDGAVWAGTISGGVSKLFDDSFTTYTIASGLASNTVAAILETRDGTMWFATPDGLSALSKGRWQSYTGRDGLPSSNVNCLLEDAGGTLWVGTSVGIAFRTSGGFQVPERLPAALQAQILGMAEDRYGALWIATANHVLRVQRDKLARGQLDEGDLREYGIADGLQGLEGVKRYRSVVSDASGRIWFSMNRGISVVDPARVIGSSVPAIVHMQTISADGNTVALREPIRISAARKRIIFSYAGLSLSVPERVRFRYTLDGFDHGWSQPVTAREAVYTNLNPGAYRFRVVASNPDGVWNSTEAAIGFQIEPLFWQSWWFRLGLVLACAFAVVAMYRFRLHQHTAKLNVRFEERLAERSRIAQELHDTLLQGFLSSSMQLHVAVDSLPEDSPAKPGFERILQLMTKVINEGRNTVRGLRSSGGASLDLEQAFSRIQQEMTFQQDVGFRVIVDGVARPLHPILRDEVYRIGREALVNAFRHSKAKKIEVELEYAASRLRILVRDNGCGIDPQVLKAGREGHWGLSGMRERAERIGAQLQVWSSAVAGTEVELSVPSHVAFQSQGSERKANWFTRLQSRRIVAHSRDINNGKTKNGREQ